MGRHQPKVDMTLQKEGRTTDRLLDGETDKEARGPHATKSTSPTEFVASLLQGPIDQGLEYKIPLEEPDRQEARRVEAPDLNVRP